VSEHNAVMCAAATSRTSATWKEGKQGGRKLRKGGSEGRPDVKEAHGSEGEVEG
jgi:hypothetical protein